MKKLKEPLLFTPVTVNAVHLNAGFAPRFRVASVLGHSVH